MIFTLTMNNLFKWAPKIMRKMATRTIWICESSCTNSMIHILQEVGTELKHLFKTSLPYTQLQTSGLSGPHLKFTNPTCIVDTNPFKVVCACI